MPKIDLDGWTIRHQGETLFGKPISPEYAQHGTIHYRARYYGSPEYVSAYWRSLAPHERRRIIDAAKAYDCDY